MSLDTFLLADQGHVDKLRLILEFAHTVDNVGLVVGPLDTELRAGHLDQSEIVESNERSCCFTSPAPLLSFLGESK